MHWLGTTGLVSQTDHYFVGWVPDELRPLGEVAAMHDSDGIRASRWWTVAELEATDETIYPKGLADLVAAGGAGGSAGAGPQGTGRGQFVDELAGVDRADAGYQVVALAAW